MKAEPFLRWVGGKQQLVATLMKFIPTDVADRRYVEPFLGAGAMFFALSPKSAYLADANQVLVDAYRSLKKNPDAVHRELEGLIGHHSKANYYEVRAQYNRCKAATFAQSARFLYLNKACFNGIFRVNTKGEFNVPKGSKDHLTVPSKNEFRAIATSLQNAEIEVDDFDVSLRNVEKNDFVYLDPPYPALNGTAFFAHYTVDRFPTSSQEKLARAVYRIDELGAKFLLSNADVPEIRKLYAGFEMDSVPVRRFVSCKGLKAKVSELIIRNY